MFLLCLKLSCISYLTDSFTSEVPSVCQIYSFLYGFALENLVWISLVLNAAPVALHVCTGLSCYTHDSWCSLLQAADGHRTPGQNQNALRRFCPSLGMMMSQHVVASVVLPDYRQAAPQIVSSRLSVAGQRRRDILGLSCGRTALPACRRTWCSLTGLCRHWAVVQPSRWSCCPWSGPPGGRRHTHWSELDIAGFRFTESAKILHLTPFICRVED